MIPKVIHYCWFGRGPKSEIIQKCMASWREFCPDYEIIEWNEDNFDVNSIPYTADAYADKKWAFVSDYARLKVVYDHGGIYLDTDVLLKNGRITELLPYNCWLVSDDARYVNTGLGFGAIKGHWLIKAIMDAYESYQYPAGTNVILDTKVLERELPAWEKSERMQTVADIVILGRDNYGTYARHLYTATWKDEQHCEKRSREIATGKDFTKKKLFLWRIKCLVRNPRLIRYFDKRKGTRIERVYTFCAYDLLDNGPIYFAKRLIRKVAKKLFPQKIND